MTSNDTATPTILFKLLGGRTDIEFVTLKGHLWLEAALRALLASRLGTDESRLPRLSFPQLADLGCGGYSTELRQQLLLINQIRNAFAHQMVPKNQSQKIRQLVRLCG